MGIAADSAGNAYVTGYASSGFPTVNAAQATYGGSTDAFVAKLNTLVSGSAGLVYSTYLGGSAADQGTAITLTGASQVAITGLTRSDNYPTKNPTQAARGGDSCSSPPCEDALVTQLSTTGLVTAQVTFSSYAGGAQDDEGRGIAHDSAGALYLTGVTFSATTGGSNSDAFLQKYTLGGGTTPPVTPQPYDETYTYDPIGNLLTKAGVGYQYGATGNGSGAGPHQARTVGLQSYQYDANGNLLTGGGRALTWDSENRVASATANGVTESSTYDADGERVTKVNGALTTVYLEGMWEETGGAVQLHYAVGGMLVAVRDSGTGAVTYLHSDHLGSVSLATTNSGSGPVVASEQLFTPWGQVRAGGIGQTSMNYTGQRLDGSGLLYYHARYYDPALARFVSADSVVPGGANGSLDGVALKPLTVDFHEPGFAATLAGENAQPFRFQMSGDQRQRAGYQGGPLNPQALNRYSYVQNNPVNGMDPSGHTWYLSQQQGRALATQLRRAAGEIATGVGLLNVLQQIITRSATASGIGSTALEGNFFRAIIVGLFDAAVAGAAAGLVLAAGLSGSLAYEMLRLANFIDDNTGADGIGIATENGTVLFVNRTTGSGTAWDPYLSPMGHFLVNHLPASMQLGAKPVYEVGDAWWKNFHFRDDERHIPMREA